MAFGDGPADQALDAAWERFCDDLRQAGRLVFKDANPPAPLRRADGFRFLTQNIGQAFDLALETKDAAYPQIHAFCTPYCKLGGDVADFTYRQAWIDGRHAYRISGRRGSARFFNVTVQGPKPAALPSGDKPLHEPFGDTPEANIFGHQLEVAADGSFELFIGGERQGANWLPTTPGSRKLFIREGFDAWEETPTPLTIERIGMDSPRPLPTAETVSEAMAWAGDFVSSMMTQWPEHSWRNSGGVVDPDQPNVFPAGKAANTAEDAKRGRLAAHMIWKLERDEALIVSFEATEGFWIMGMGGAFVNSMDFLYRPVSYTPARAKVDADGKVRLVLAHEDPGVWNWVDTQSFGSGNLTYRMLQSQTAPRLETRLVKRADLFEALPSDTSTITPEERVAEMWRRYRSVKRRYAM
ncbi:MAG: DUF1214 domain-containing protein [Novosphingobium sp.]|nr:DUF1214 domain-containing protein [Novosphingobium sp.]